MSVQIDPKLAAKFLTGRKLWLHVGLDVPRNEGCESGNSVMAFVFEKAMENTKQILDHRSQHREGPSPQSSLFPEIKDVVWWQQTPQQMIASVDEKGLAAIAQLPEVVSLRRPTASEIAYVSAQRIYIRTILTLLRSRDSAYAGLKNLLMPQP